MTRLQTTIRLCSWQANYKRIIIFKFSILILFVIWCFGFGTSLHAQSVDILWQGEVSIPPFYEGRSLWARQSTITFLAIPQGLGGASSLTYRWMRNGTVLGSLSGMGKNTLSIQDGALSRSQTISVEVLSADTYDSPILARSSVVVTPIAPLALIYESHPLYGIMFHREVGSTYSIESQESSFRAFPLFFDNSMSPLYEWRSSAGGVSSNPFVTYRVPDNASGSSRIEIEISHPEKILEKANRRFLIEFGNEML